MFEAEPAAEGLMQEPPRPAGAPLFSGRAIASAVGVGLLALAGTAVVQAIGHRAGWGYGA